MGAEFLTFLPESLQKDDFSPEVYSQNIILFDLELNPKCFCNIDEAECQLCSDAVKLLISPSYRVKASARWVLWVYSTNTRLPQHHVLLQKYKVYNKLGLDWGIKHSEASSVTLYSRSANQCIRQMLISTLHHLLTDFSSLLTG